MVVTCPNHGCGHQFPESSRYSVIIRGAAVSKNDKLIRSGLLPSPGMT